MHGPGKYRQEDQASLGYRRTHLKNNKTVLTPALSKRMLTRTAEVVLSEWYFHHGVMEYGASYILHWS